MPPVTRKRLKEVADGDRKETEETNESAKIVANTGSPIAGDDSIKMRTRRQTMLINRGKENMNTPSKGDSCAESDSEEKLQGRNRLTTPQKRVHNSCGINSIAVVQAMSHCELSPAKRKLRRFSMSTAGEKNDSDSEEILPKKRSFCSNLYKNDYISSIKQPQSIPEEDESNINVQIASGGEHQDEISVYSTSVPSPVNNEKNKHSKASEPDSDVEDEIPLKKLCFCSNLCKNGCISPRYEVQAEIHNRNGPQSTISEEDKTSVNVQMESGEKHGEEMSVHTSSILSPVEGKENMKTFEPAVDEIIAEISVNDRSLPLSEDTDIDNDIRVNVQSESIKEPIQGKESTNTTSILNPKSVEEEIVEENIVRKIDPRIINSHQKVMEHEERVNVPIESGEQIQDEKSVTKTSIRNSSCVDDGELFQAINQTVVKDNSEKVAASIVSPPHSKVDNKDINSMDFEIKSGEEQVWNKKSAITTSNLIPRNLNRDSKNDIEIIDITESEEGEEVGERDGGDTCDLNFTLRIDLSPESNHQEEDIVVGEVKRNYLQVAIDTRISIGNKEHIVEEDIENKDKLQGKREGIYLEKLQVDEDSDDSEIEASLPPCGQVYVEKDGDEECNQGNKPSKNPSVGNSDICDCNQEPDSELEELYPPSAQQLLQKSDASCNQSDKGNSENCRTLDINCSGNSIIENIGNNRKGILLHEGENSWKDLIPSDEQKVENEVCNDSTGKSDSEREDLDNLNGNKYGEECLVYAIELEMCKEFSSNKDGKHSNVITEDKGARFSEEEEARARFSEEEEARARFSEEEEARARFSEEEEARARFSEEEEAEDSNEDGDLEEDLQEEYCEVPRKRFQGGEHCEVPRGRAYEFIDFEAEEGEESDYEEEEAEEEEESENEDDSDDIVEEDPKKLAKIFLNDEAEDDFFKKKKRRILIIESDDESGEEDTASEKRLKGGTPDSCIEIPVSCENSYLVGLPEVKMSMELSVNGNLSTGTSDDMENDVPCVSEVQTMTSKDVGVKKVLDCGNDICQEVGDRTDEQKQRSSETGMSDMEGKADYNLDIPVSSSNEKSLDGLDTTCKCSPKTYKSSHKIMNTTHVMHSNETTLTKNVVNQEKVGGGRTNKSEPQMKSKVAKGKSNVSEHDLIQNKEDENDATKYLGMEESNVSKMCSQLKRRREMKRRKIEEVVKIPNAKVVKDIASSRNLCIEKMMKRAALKRKEKIKKQFWGNWDVAERKITILNGWNVQEQKTVSEEILKCTANNWDITNNVSDRDGPWVVRDNVHDSKSRLGTYKILVKNFPRNWMGDVKKLLQINNSKVSVERFGGTCFLLSLSSEKIMRKILFSKPYVLKTESNSRMLTCETFPVWTVYVSGVPLYLSNETVTGDLLSVLDHSSVYDVCIPKNSLDNRNIGHVILKVIDEETRNRILNSHQTTLWGKVLKLYDEIKFHKKFILKVCNWNFPQSRSDAIIELKNQIRSLVMKNFLVVCTGNFIFLKFFHESCTKSVLQKSTTSVFGEIIYFTKFDFENYDCQSENFII